MSGFPYVPKLGPDYGSPVARGPWQLVDADPNLATAFGDPATPFASPSDWSASNGQLIDTRGITALELQFAAPAGETFLIRSAGFTNAGGVYVPTGYTLTADVDFSPASTNPTIGSIVAGLNPNLNAAWKWASDFTPLLSPIGPRVQRNSPGSGSPVFLRVFIDEFDFFAIADRGSTSGVSPVFIRPIQGVWDSPTSNWWTL